MDSMYEYAIELNGLRKEYKGFTLNNIDLKVKKGTIMGFIGENGAGKTTTIKSIIGTIHPTAGEIKIFGCTHRLNDAAYKQDIGIVFDECFFHPVLNLKQIDKIFSGIYTNWDHNLYMEFIHKLKLPNEKTIKDYSSGMKTKLSIAVAMSHRPKLLLLDEATSGLDPVVRNEILDVLLEFIQDEEHTVLFSSHITTDLEKICDYITFIRDGSIVFSDDKNTILESYGVVRCGEEEYRAIPSSIIKGYHKNRFAYDVLISDHESYSSSHPGVTIDTASFDDIMLLYGKY